MGSDTFDTIALQARLTELIDLARIEDLGEVGDLSTQLLPGLTGDAEYRLVSRQAGVLAGLPVAGGVLAAYDPRIEFSWARGVTDGSKLAAGDEIAGISGPVTSVLAAERVLLNFLQRLCGIATATRAYVDAIEGTIAEIYDTRKTTPGWRILEKYAVRCGGGLNHRMGLHDAVLIKDNHLADVPLDRLANVLFELLSQVSALNPPPAFVEIEADTIEQLEQIFKVSGVDLVLLDNFTNRDLKRAVGMRDALGLRGKVELEASGGVTLETVREIAETGVDRISVGAITHSAPALDLALERV